MSIKAMKQAIEAWDACGRYPDSTSDIERLDVAINALRTAIQQADAKTDEPVQADSSGHLRVIASLDAECNSLAHQLNASNERNGRLRAALSDCSAELFAQCGDQSRAMSYVNAARAALAQNAPMAATPDPVVDVRCEGCGYMTHHREHMGCVRAAKQYTHPAQGVPDTLKDHQIAAMVNTLRDIARQFHGHDSLRERIANVLVPALKAEAQQPATAIACGVPGMAKTTCPYCEQGFAFEYEQPATPEPVGEPRARVELVKTGGNAGLSTRIIELDIATRERLRPGDLLYTRPSSGVPVGQAPSVWNSIQIASWIGSQLMREPSMFERSAVCKFVRSLGRHPTLLKHSPKDTHLAPGVPDDVARNAIATVREQYRGTDWGKAAECICDAIDAAMLATQAKKETP